MIDLSIEDVRWREMGLDALAARAVAAVMADQQLNADMFEVSLLACDDARIAILNADFRDKSGATNVLSWPSEDLSAEADGDNPLRPAEPQDDDPFEDEVSLGDIALAYETCLREAEAAGKPVKDHVTHLVIHGTLHLLGYDHIRDNDATLMEAREIAILAELGIANPY